MGKRRLNVGAVFAASFVAAQYYDIIIAKLGRSYVYKKNRESGTSGKEGMVRKGTKIH